jgi:uncharacterized membrane protein
MAKSIIVYGVPRGKTRFAQRIADHFGLRIAENEFANDVIHMYGYLYLTRIAQQPKGNFTAASRSFQSVADEINATIGLTDWQSGPPPMVGEWNASAFKRDDTRRWWDGDKWSMNYINRDCIEHRARMAHMRASRGDSKKGIEWRGLSAEPIKVTE